MGTVGRVRTILLTFPVRKKKAAYTAGRNVLPVPAGPVVMTRSFLWIASSKRRCVDVLGFGRVGLSPFFAIP